MQPTRQLKEEHKSIRLMLKVEKGILEQLANGRTVNPVHLDMISEFVHIFVEKCHFGKEEALLFPALEQLGGMKDSKEIRELLDEHSSLHCLLNQLLKDIAGYEKTKPKASPDMIKDMKDYIELLKVHIDKEETILYPLADTNLPATVQGELMWRFEEYEEEVVAGDEPEKLSRIANVIIDEYVNKTFGA